MVKRGSMYFHTKNNNNDTLFAIGLVVVMETDKWWMRKI